MFSKSTAFERQATITDLNAIEIVENEHNHLSKKRKVSNETYLWHWRLGHINPNRIHGLVKSGILNSLSF